MAERTIDFKFDKPNGLAIKLQKLDSPYPSNPSRTLQAVPGAVSGVCFRQKNHQVPGYLFRVIPVVDIPDIQLHPPTTMPSSNRTSKRSRKQGASSSQPPHQSKKESETAPQSKKDQPKDVSQDQEEEDDSGAA
ncbi:hypothetical protein PCANC_08759 [Puccinia coronata f. sp. avenae]|uniref:Uncharacterized protein n=1 Tax=Puccinia coronata f. sp. avenae TaxID=200324 RepID=A0A2N5T1W5_9BASI|nr:hypothetical protein PCANC_08759 [Puccinia coronata f. sp. avenae]